MTDKLLVIIGTAERTKAQAGVMYALNAVRCRWPAASWPTATGSRTGCASWAWRWNTWGR